MRWRTPLAVVLSLFLLLPLAWVIHVAMSGGVRPTPDAKVAPMLSTEERRSLMTYERPCGGSKDCESPLGCFFNTRARWMYCTDSRCMTDQQCSEDMACRTLKTVGGGLPIRHCTLVGVQKEGDSCFEMPSSRDEACERGLLCQERRCGRPCRLDEPESCPEGFFCREGLNGPSCLPTCEGRSCSVGQECVRLEEGVSVCAEVHGQNCQQTPCPGEQKCFVWNPPNHPNEVWMTCLIRCGEENTPPCPDGFVCKVNYCRRSCDPGTPDVCGPYYRCDRYKTEPWTCRPDL